MTLIRASEPAAGGLAEALPAQKLAPLWTLYSQLVRREPRASECAHHWPWARVAPFVTRAEHEVMGPDADHRALILAHPDFAPRPKTTSRLIAAVQCVRPGEQTLEHRHTAAACRFILEGEGGATFVDGRRCAMARNDFIVTPNWTWHSHANDSASRAVWLDILDVPLMGALDTTFGEAGPAPAHTLGGAEPRPGPAAVQLRWSWDDTLAALAASVEQDDGVRSCPFKHPVDAGPILSTLEAAVMALPAGRWTAGRRTSASAIAVVIEGQGESRIGERSVVWSERDVFTLPHWQWARHRARDGAARLMVVSDAQAMRSLGVLRTEQRG